MPSSRFCVVSHWLWSPCSHMKQCPQEMLNGTTTRSPTARLSTPEPTASTTPIGSWPSTSPASMNGPSTSYRCRSDPHSPVEVTRMIASVGCSMVGSGTVIDAHVALSMPGQGLHLICSGR